MATRLMVLGRFALDGNDSARPLHFEMNLFGTEPTGETLQLTAIRNATDHEQVLMLTAGHSGGALFPSTWQVFADYTVLGAEHIVTGPDHLLFLLVVLAAGWSWRHVFLALTTFTVGHAMSLMVSVEGGLTVSSGIVEPAIAATIVGMALFDILARRSPWAPSTLLRLSLVFACSLIHGLGLSSALSDLGLDKQHQLPSLAGFNIGIELAQLTVALVAGALALCLLRVRGENAVATATSAGSFGAIAIGSAWFLQRTLM